MKRTFFRKSTVLAAALAAVAAVASCTMKNQQPPSLTGPSELGTSVVVTVSPDTIQQDGASQSLITVTARDSNGNPLRNLSLRSEIFAGGTRVDFGTLSARNIVTGADGRATFVYTAPASPSGPAVDTNTTVEIRVTPLGTDFANEQPRIATIRLLPVGVVVPPDGLAPAFTINPTSPNDHELVFFDGTTSKSPANNPIVGFTWDFGDGSRGTGATATHTFNSSGTFQVSLTITDSFGRSATTSQTVTVGAGNGPTVGSITVSPTGPRIGDTVNFSAAGAKAAPGRTIRSFEWNFGDGESKTTSSPTTTHDYQRAGVYVVTLTVTDDAGRTGVQTQSVTVLTDAPLADFVFSPAAPAPGAPVAFNSAASRAIEGRTITSYSWIMSDGFTSPSANPTHAFANAGDYNVTLTVTDSAGKTNTTTKTVPVK